MIIASVGPTHKIEPTYKKTNDKIWNKINLLTSPINVEKPENLFTVKLLPRQVANPHSLKDINPYWLQYGGQINSYENVHLSKNDDLKSNYMNPSDSLNAINDHKEVNVPLQNTNIFSDKLEKIIQENEVMSKLLKDLLREKTLQTKKVHTTKPKILKLKHRDNYMNKFIVPIVKSRK